MSWPRWKMVKMTKTPGVVAAILTKMDLDGLSQAEVARRSGVKQGIISRILRGKMAPKPVTVAKLLDALKIHIDGY